jgi:succinate dehydrogenase / fumarate reductase flavoprotein subunit
VEPDTELSGVTGLYSVGECSGGMHGSNRLGGNSLSDLLVFGRRAGEAAASYAAGLGVRPTVDAEAVKAAEVDALSPFDPSTTSGVGDAETDESANTENPYTIQQDLQQTMNDLVGIIRTADELSRSLEEIEKLKARSQHLLVEGHRQYNPGWHLAIDLQNMLWVSECIARAALTRTESRGGHTRDDYPMTDPDWGTKNIVLREKEGAVDLVIQPLPPMPAELKALFEQ